jgi:hypothetical protein
MGSRFSGVALLSFVAASAAACRSGQSTESAPAAQSATATQSAAPVAAGPGDGGTDALCTAILEGEKLDERALQLDDRKNPGPRLLCLSTGRFAWALRLDPPAPPASSVRQTLVFSSADGARGRLESTLDKVDWPPVLGRHTGMFDFDDDGVPELFTLVPANVRSYEPASRVFVTFKNGAISPYPTGKGYVVDQVVDLDGDGRPDLKVAFELGKRTACQPGEEGALRIELVAHGLKDGTFTLDDPMTWAMARRSCPAMPTSDAMFVASMPPSPPDARDLSMAYVSCSRLRGKAAEAVASEIGAACTGKVDATKKCAGPCRHLADAIAIAKFNPPLRLTDAPHGDAGPAK